MMEYSLYKNDAQLLKCRFSLYIKIDLAADLESQPLRIKKKVWGHWWKV